MKLVKCRHASEQFQELKSKKKKEKWQHHQPFHYRLRALTVNIFTQKVNI